MGKKQVVGVWNPRGKYWQHLGVGLACVAALGGGGCGTEALPPPRSAVPGLPSLPEDSPSDAREVAERSQNASRLEAQRPAPLSVDTLLQAAETFLADEASAPMEEGVSTGLAARLALEHADLLGEVYARRDGQPGLVQDSTLSPAGRAIHHALLQAHTHALDAERLSLPSVAAALQRWQKVAGSHVLLTLQNDERSALEVALAGIPAGEAAATARLWLSSSNPVEAGAPLRLAAQRRQQEILEREQTRAELELRLANAALTYASEMRKWGDLRPEDDKPVSAKALEHERGRLEALLHDLLREGVAAADVIEDLAPPFEQYARLRKGYARYRELCNSGGWTTVDTGPVLTTGSRGPRVQALRERLRAEGYYQGQADDELFDETLHEAVVRYQETHQFDPNGKVDKGLVESLNVSCRDRIAQIGLTLSRWRQTRIGNPGGRYVFVNIPDFHGEVWDEGERVHRFKVITGLRTHRKRADGTRIFKHATPELTAPMKFVVFNPEWNVPESIRKHEIEPEMAKDPDYLEKHHYERIENADGSVLIRQKPGPWNALGRVKFLFPNPHDVYLHDTPNKKLFSRPVRAFSHGCMRVHNPMDLAKVIMNLDGGWRDMYETTGERQWVTLKDHIPVYVDYFVVRVDDEGWVHFNADVYYRDEPRLAVWLQSYPAGGPQVAGGAPSDVPSGLASGEKD